MKNAADPTQVKEAEKREKSRELQRAADMQKILGLDFGRRFIWDLLEFCGENRLSFTGNSETFFNEGQRNVGLRLKADVMRANPEAYIQMMKDSLIGEQS